MIWPSFSLFKCPELLKPISLPGWSILLYQDAGASDDRRALRTRFIFKAWGFSLSAPLRSFLPSQGGAREAELSANASCPPVGAESWSWPPCPQPLISTVTGEVRPPSTHRQPLVQSHSPAINKKPHLHKLTGTQCSHPSHLQGLHIHIDWLGPTVWPTWLLFFIFIFFFKCMQSSVTVEVIRISYSRLREFEGCTQFSEHSLLMSHIKCNINQPHVNNYKTQHKVLSFLIGQYVGIWNRQHHLHTRDAFHLITFFIHLALELCV